MQFLFSTLLPSNSNISFIEKAKIFKIFYVQAISYIVRYLCYLCLTIRHLNTFRN